MRIYTRTGDGGQTGLLGGLRISKCDERFEVMGTLDELSAVLGFVIAVCRSSSSSQESRGATSEEIPELLEAIQRDLFSIGAYLAKPELPDTSPVSKARIAELERQIDQLEHEAPPLLNFILPGGTVANAELHVARAVCRRAERAVVRLTEKLALDPLVIAYLNRLSDWLFIAARAVNARAGIEETTWKGSS